MTSGRRPKHPREVTDALAREYRSLKAANTLPPEWVTKKAVELKVTVQCVYRYIEACQVIDESRERAAMGLSHFDNEALKRGPGSRSVHASKFWEAN